MNFKKLAILTSSAVLMLATTVPAFANGGWGGGFGSGGSDVAIVDNSSTAFANTGFNTQLNNGTLTSSRVGYNGEVKIKGENGLKTGNASADSKAVVIANVHKDDCECLSRKHKDVAMVVNYSGASADSGLNLQSNNGLLENAKVKGDVEINGDNWSETGHATSRSRAWTVVNVHKN